MQTIEYLSPVEIAARAGLRFWELDRFLRVHGIEPAARISSYRGFTEAQAREIVAGVRKTTSRRQTA